MAIGLALEELPKARNLTTKAITLYLKLNNYEHTKNIAYNEGERINVFSFLLFLRKRGSKMRENKFQANLIKEIKELFPGCVVLKNDPNYIQGIPDILILFNDKWASLECKRSKGASVQPNQSYYVDKMNQMSYSSFVYPENKEEVLNGLQSAFQSGRTTRVSRRK